MNTHGYKQSKKRMTQHIKYLQTRIDFLKQEKRKPIKHRENFMENQEIDQEIESKQKKIKELEKAKNNCSKIIKTLQKTKEKKK